MHYTQAFPCSSMHTRKIGKGWSIMWCNDDVWTLFGTWFEISTYSPTHFLNIVTACTCSYWWSNDGTAHSGCWKNNSISPSYNRHTSAVVIVNVTLWTACNGQVILLWKSVIFMTMKRAGTQQCNDDCWTRHACGRRDIRLQSYLTTCSLCC